MYALKKDNFKASLFMRLTITAIAGLFFVFPQHTAHAATLTLTASDSSVEVGDTFMVRIKLTSPIDAVNAVSGVLNFQNSFAKLTTLSKSSSIIGLWVKDPSYSVSTANFEGVILNPGFTGTGGIVLTAQFKALKEGTAVFTLTDGQALANDGSGTDILTGVTGTSVTIGPATVKPQKPITPSTPTVPEASSPTPIVTNLEQPVIISPLLTMKVGETIQITVASKYPNARITLSLAPIKAGSTDVDAAAQLRTFEGPSDGSGKAIFTLPNNLTEGLYQMAARVMDASGNQSTPFQLLLLVSPVGWSDIHAWAENIGMGFILGIILILIALSSITLYARYRLHLYESRHPRGSGVVSREFVRLKDDIESFVRDFEGEKNKRKLTVLENKYLKKMKQYLDMGE